MSDDKKKPRLSLAAGGRFWMLGAGLVLGVLLLIWGSGGGRESAEEQPTPTAREEMYYSEMLEEKLTAFLSEVSGIESVNVLVTVDAGSEYEYAGKGGGEGYAADYLVINGESGEEPAVVQEIYPKLRGVAVACTGGDSAAVKERVTSLLSTALGISANKIEVAGND